MILIFGPLLIVLACMVALGGVAIIIATITGSILGTILGVKDYKKKGAKNGKAR